MKKYIIPFLLGMAFLKVAQNKTVQNTVKNGIKTLRDKVKSEIDSLKQETETIQTEQTAPEEKGEKGAGEQPLPHKPVE